MISLEPFVWLKAVWERRRVQRLSRDQLVAEQSAKFHRLVRLAYERSPFYRAIIESRGLDLDSCRPTDFPVLTKQMVAENFDRILTDPTLSLAQIEDFLAHSHNPNELLDGRYHVLHSSGTSGTVGHVVYSQAAWITGSSQMLRVLPCGWDAHRVCCGRQGPFCRRESPRDGQLRLQPPVFQRPDVRRQPEQDDE